MSERHPPVIDERTFQRRRLGVLAGLLALVLAASPFLDPSGGDAPDVQVAAGDDVVRTAAVGSPTAIRELLSETTTTLVEATGATTTSIAPVVVAPTTTVAREPVETEPEVAARPADVEDDEDEGDDPELEEAPATTPAPATTAPPTTAAPAPERAPATTTTTAPARTTSEEYAYDDPRSTQVWYDLADCESGGRWSIDSGNGYYGGLQFSLGTWESVGGTGYPHEHPAATQIEMGRRLQARQGWGAWPHCSEELGLR